MDRKIIRRSTALALALTMGIARASFHGRSDAPGSTRDRALQRQPNRHLVYPVMAAQDLTGTVTVSFAVRADGRLEVIEATGTNAALCAFVLQRLARVDIGENPGGVWCTSRIRFVFGPEA
jgi:hypothetical protein